MPPAPGGISPELRSILLLFVLFVVPVLLTLVFTPVFAEILRGAFAGERRAHCAHPERRPTLG